MVPGTFDAIAVMVCMMAGAHHFAVMPGATAYVSRRGDRGKRDLA